jgi:hypothetical protein
MTSAASSAIAETPKHLVEGGIQPLSQALSAFTAAGLNVVTGPQSAALRAHQTGLAEHLQVMGDGRL